MIPFSGIKCLEDGLEDVKEKQHDTFITLQIDFYVYLNYGSAAAQPSALGSLPPHKTPVFESRRMICPRPKVAR